MLSRELPYLTTTPGIGGVLKNSPDDFRVDEVPLYEPSGEGPHFFLLVEKRDLTTPFMIARLAESLGINPNNVGVAGRKDRMAVTRQYVSIPDRDYSEEQLLNLKIEGARVVSCKRHVNKLKTGHLKANRFEIVVRDTVPDALSIARETQAQLERLGFPNWYGEQRFGYADDTDDVGFQLLKGMNVGRLSKNKLRFALSAAQSRMFNEWLADRMADGLIKQVIVGDVMQFMTTRTSFVVEDVAAEQPRFDVGEIVPTGPMYGSKMPMPKSEAAARESAVLDRFELKIEAFDLFRKLATGTRRRMLVKPANFEIEPIENGLRFRFELASGVYATTILREFTKAAL